MPRFQPISWGKYDLGNPRFASSEDLRRVVKSAASTANSRLLRLERASLKNRAEGKPIDYTKSGAYMRAMRGMTNGRRRFPKDVNKMQRAELIQVYIRLRDFLSLKSSTVSGYNESMARRYVTAVERGFKGDFSDFLKTAENVWTEANKSLYDSEILYQVQQTRDYGLLDRITEAAEARAKAIGIDPKDRGNIEVIKVKMGIPRR